MVTFRHVILNAHSVIWESMPHSIVSPPISLGPLYINDFIFERIVVLGPHHHFLHSRFEHQRQHPFNRICVRRQIGSDLPPQILHLQSVGELLEYLDDQQLRLLHQSVLVLLSVKQSKVYSVNTNH